MKGDRLKGIIWSAAVAAGVMVGGTAYAQAPPSAGTADAGDGTQATSSQPAPRAPERAAAPLARWVEMQSFQLNARYRFIESSAGVVSSDSVQTAPAIKGRVKVDRGGRLSVHFNATSGGSFTSGWNNTGLGMGDYDGAFSMKQLYVSVQPMSGVEIHAGGLAPARGQSTEITTYDNDGFLTGERVVVKRPRTLWFDEVSLTAGYLGDLSTPNVFRRFERMDDHNYYQALVAKKLPSGVAVSADVTKFDGAWTIRQGAVVPTPALVVVDTVRVELYQRVEPDTAQGLAVTVDKRTSSRLSLGGGFGSIDPAYGGLNGDRFNRGSRVFATGAVVLSSDFTLSWWLGEGVGNDRPIGNQRRVDVLLTFNPLKRLQRARVF